MGLLPCIGLLVWFGGCPAGTEPKGQRGTRKEASGGATSREPCDASRLIPEKKWPGFLWMPLVYHKTTPADFWWGLVG